MFPKKGKFFPGIERYHAAVAAALKAELGDSRQAIKTVMRWTGANERTVKNWLSAKGGPRGEHLICLLHYSDKMLEVILQLAGREHVAAATAVLEARNMLRHILEKIDSWLAEQG